MTISDLKIEPSAANKGENLVIEGSVSSLSDIEDIKYTVVDDKGAPAQNVTVSSNALAGGKKSWNLKNDAQAKIVTTQATASGKYRLRVEAKVDEKQDSEEVTFDVR